MERRERGSGGTTMESWKEGWEKEEGMGLEWSHGGVMERREGRREERGELECNHGKKGGRDGVSVES